jgi:hypothetical protein
MQLLTEAINAIGAALLQIAVGLLIEELTFGGLVRLILAPRSASGKHEERKHTGESKCSR